MSVEIDLENLPEDKTVIKGMFTDLVEALNFREQENTQLKHRLSQLIRQQFGRRSERFNNNPDQLLMDFIRELPEDLQDELMTPDVPDPEKPRKRGGRQKLPENLPRITEESTLAEEERQCKDCAIPMEKVDEVVTEIMDYKPASFHVRKVIRDKYACRNRDCEGDIKTAPGPLVPIEKSMAGAGLLAHILVNKYCDHLPLYRQEGIFARQGITLSRGTMCHMVAGCTDVLEPLWKRMQKKILEGDIIQTDDTPVPVQESVKRKRKRKIAMRKGRLWVYIGDEKHPYTVFDFSSSRHGEYPEAFLDGYEGYMQADAYAGYDKIYATQKVTEVGCMAHARRKFYDARNSDPPRARVAVIDYIWEAYKIERAARGQTPAYRQELRDKYACPILEKFKTWLLAEQHTVLPKSPMGGAITYALNHWDALTRYIEDPRLEIDNNAAERTLRNCVIGRNNWLFAGSPQGGHRAAVLYSVLSSCKRHGVEPWAYLQDVLTRINTHPARLIDELLPDNWKKKKEEAEER